MESVAAVLGEEWRDGLGTRSVDRADEIVTENVSTACKGASFDPEVWYAGFFDSSSSRLLANF